MSFIPCHFISRDVRFMKALSENLFRQRFHGIKDWLLIFITAKEV